MKLSRLLAPAALALLLAILLAALRSGRFRPGSDVGGTAFQTAKKYFQEGQLDQAAEWSRKALEAAPDSEDGLALALRVALAQDDQDSMDVLAAKLGELNPRLAANIEVDAGHRAFQEARLFACEHSLRRALLIHPEDLESQGLLAYVLLFEGRAWEARPYLLGPVRQQQAPPEHLLLLAAQEPQIENTDLAGRAAGHPSDQEVLTLHQAVLAASQGRSEEALETLRGLSGDGPAMLDGQTRLGLLLAESGSPEFPDWDRHLPAAAREFPRAWLARGVWQLSRRRWPMAARCFVEAARRDPSDMRAASQLGQVLRRLGRERDAEPLLSRAAELLRLESLAQDLRLLPADSDSRTRADIIRHLAECNARLERWWEARAWARQALAAESRERWASELMQTADALLSPAAPQTLTRGQPALRIDLSDLPLPAADDWSGIVAAHEASEGPTGIDFQDEAADRGIDFTYFNGEDSHDEGVRLLETTGGGVAALDYDVDNYPDLYFTQGGPWPRNAETSSINDQLFRNSAAGGFENVTGSCGIKADGYSQGVAAGDINNDGFPDLYVAAIGRNRLFLNNGDGTFSENDVDDAQTARWTTSCLIADLNGDGAPDLYDVNYASTNDIERAVCISNHQIKGCTAGPFRPERDRILVSEGQGLFRNATDEAGLKLENGMGLGIVAADFQGRGRLDLFVGNDAFPNHYYANQSGQVPDGSWLDERGLQLGVGVDDNGAPQATMGIAAGDADGDGQLDILVTNFRDEGATLYRQQGHEFFVDQTRLANLRAPTLPMLGFGAQFLDADADGSLDLVVANGHVFDFGDPRIPYRMRPQFFWNDGRGEFRELPLAHDSPFFAADHLGRGLARIDWNADGLDDFAVSQINSPAALVTNHTRTGHRTLSIHLVALDTARDAIGAEVRLQVADRLITRQLTAGDGYQASNERRLSIGLGQSAYADRLEVRWPSGRTQQWTNIAAGGRLTLVEGVTSTYSAAAPSPDGAAK